MNTIARYPRLGFLILGLSAAMLTAPAAEPSGAKGPVASELLAKSKPADWRELDPENTLYLQLASGRVIIELTPAFAPHHVANVRALAREKYYDGLAVVRVQDNYVTQWGDPEAGNPSMARPVTKAKPQLPAEFDRAFDARLPFTPMPDQDVYARETGFSDGFPIARDKRARKMWLTHTYGMVGAGRDDSPDSGGGRELYVVIGHAPRHLDRNATLFGRVVWGMELLSSLPRGTGAMGFYEKPAERTPIRSIRVASDVPVAERTELEVLRTDTPLFRQLIEARRNRLEPWFKNPAHRLDIGNMPLPVRPKPAPPS